MGCEKQKVVSVAEALPAGERNRGRTGKARQGQTMQGLSGHSEAVGSPLQVLSKSNVI